MSNREIAERYEFAVEIGAVAGQVTMRYFLDQALSIEKKGDESPVTIADRQCEEELRALIGRQFPDDAIVGEEFGVSEGTSGYRWILDPIDGTKSFITGVPLFGNMVGVARDEESVIGVVVIPALNEMIYAAIGQGCWWKRGERAPRPAWVSNCERLADSTFVTSEVKTFGERGMAEAYRELEKRTYIARTWGDCYGYLLVATGRAELMVDPILSIWDAAAVQPIISEAGGKFTDWQGNPSIDSGDAIGSNGRIHDDVLELISRFAEPRQSSD